MSAIVKVRINMAINAQPATVLPKIKVSGKLMARKVKTVILNQLGLDPKKLLSIVFFII